MSEPAPEHENHVPATGDLAAEPEAAADTTTPFIDPVSMERDPEALFAGDQGTLEGDVRRVLVYLLQRRFISAERHSTEWKILLEHQPLIESRLHDLYVRLVIDHQHGLAYKQQVRVEELDVPILLRDTPYTRAETLVLVHLRTIYQRETTVGEQSARVDIEDIEQTVLSYFVDEDGSIAKRQKKIRGAIDRLLTEGIITEDTTGRYLISPLIEVVLKAEKLVELRDWLRERAANEAGYHAGMEVGRDDLEPSLAPDLAPDLSDDPHTTHGTDQAVAKDIEL